MEIPCINKVIVSYRIVLVRDQVVHLETAAKLWQAGAKQRIISVSRFFLVFELGGTKHLPRGTLRVSEKQNSVFPLGPVISAISHCQMTINRATRARA